MHIATYLPTAVHVDPGLMVWSPWFWALIVEDSVSVVESERRTGEPRYISSQVIGTTLHGTVMVSDRTHLPRNSVCSLQRLGFQLNSHPLQMYNWLLAKVLLRYRYNVNCLTLPGSGCSLDGTSCTSDAFACSLGTFDCSCKVGYRREGFICVGMCTKSLWYWLNGKPVWSLA